VSSDLQTTNLKPERSVGTTCRTTTEPAGEKGKFEHESTNEAKDQKIEERLRHKQNRRDSLISKSKLKSKKGKNNSTCE
jgi:hypothetical protein